MKKKRTKRDEAIEEIKRRLKELEEASFRRPDEERFPRPEENPVPWRRTPWGYQWPWFPPLIWC